MRLSLEDVTTTFILPCLRVFSRDFDSSLKMKIELLSNTLGQNVVSVTSTESCEVCFQCLCRVVVRRTDPHLCCSILQVTVTKIDWWRSMEPIPHLTLSSPTSILTSISFIKDANENWEILHISAAIT